MKLFPAIDLVQGKAVRLLKGDYAQMTVYSDDPAAVAQGFRAAGAEYLHMVDLEGARDGGTPNFDIVTRVIGQCGLHVEIGGGIRGLDVIEKYLNAGAFRVILGTAAVTDRAFLREAIKRYGPRVAVGVDVKDGFVAIKGWRETSAETLDSFCTELMHIGVETVICTDISKDGAMQGTNRELYQKLTQRYPMQFTASGGVSTLKDVRALREMGLYGAILGKALYTGAIDLKEAIEEAAK
ncbi:MAG: 1-(5-phosphoribosyl)-5-[Clostridia bacterium]|nr:1-(5-phosphoribosyl)-5-[(5-phosphoribosylamino)methylideneamino]imidazole-4-carboxamide isomerase [Clostridia bacterium]